MVVTALRLVPRLYIFPNGCVKKCYLDLNRQSAFKQRGAIMTRLGIVIAAMAFFIGCTDERHQVNADGATPKNAGTMVSQAAVNEAAGALGTASLQKAYVDPQTEELIPRPAENEAADVASTSISSLGSSDDAALVVKPSPVPGGGIMVDLMGRFRNPIKATVDHRGRVFIEHPDENRTE